MNRRRRQGQTQGQPEFMKMLFHDGTMRERGPLYNNRKGLPGPLFDSTPALLSDPACKLSLGPSRLPMPETPTHKETLEDAMQRFLPKTAMAAVLSCTLALSGVAATPGTARADSEDAAAIIAGIIALYAIGRAVERRNDRRDHRPAVTPQPPRQHDLVAPARCFREFQTTGGYVRGYGARCMQNNVRRPGLLPPDCIRRVQTNRGTRNLYGGRCLARNGWQRERGFHP